MGGPGSGLNRTNPNGTTISAIDEARWRLIEAEENEKKCQEYLGRAYTNVKEANREVAAAIAELAAIQKSLGDKDLTDRESHRVGDLTVSTPAGLVRTIVENARARKTA